MKPDETMKQSIIGVLTLHYGFNEGAVLQSMATCQMLRRLSLAEQVEVVDHRYPAKQEIYGPADTPRAKAILNAVNHWLPLSPERFESAEREPTYNYCSERYGSLVVGSDVVWAMRYVGRLRRFFPQGVFPRQNDPFFPAFPNVYWPDESVDCRKIAYAACCGNLDPAEVPKKDLRRMAAILDGFAGLSVRDEKTLRFVKSFSKELGRETVIVPDPTVAFNLLGVFDGSSSLDKLIAHGFDPDGKWALLVMKEGRVSRIALRILKQKGYSVAATGSYSGEVDLDLVACGLSPLEWGWMPRYFALNVTERMHSSIFTVLNRTPLLALDMNRRLPDMKTKLEERMEVFGLEKFYAHQETVSEKEVEQRVDLAIEDACDWDSIHRRMDNERGVAQAFLKRAYDA